MSTINNSLRLLMNLAKMQAVMARKFDGLSVHGIGFSDFMILYLLRQAPGERLRRTDLAEKVGLTASGITRMLIPLEKTGLVARESSERDARVSYAVLTSAGRQIYREAKETANDIAKEIVPGEIARNESLPALFKLLGATI
jgi:DNA-binding MarR family transcriptional regulator